MGSGVMFFPPLFRKIRKGTKLLAAQVDLEFFSLNGVFEEFMI